MRIRSNVFRRGYCHRRRGKIVVLIAILLPCLLAMVSFAIDLQVLYLTRSQLQRNANAAALGSALELLPDAQPAFPLQSPLELSLTVPGVAAVDLDHDLTTKLGLLNTEIALIDPQKATNQGRVYQVIDDLCLRNDIMGVSSFDQRREDIQILNVRSSVPAPNLLPLNNLTLGLTGTVERLLLRPLDEGAPNAVRVRTRRDNLANDPIRLFFGPMVGTEYAKTEATATAALFKGYGVRPGAKMLPIANGYYCLAHAADRKRHRQRCPARQQVIGVKYFRGESGGYSDLAPIESIDFVGSRRHLGNRLAVTTGPSELEPWPSGRADRQG